MFCFCLNHDADERFRAARADEHASLAGELPLLLRDGRGECIGRHDGILDAALMRNGDVEQHLRILRADGRKLRGLLPAAREHVEELKRRQLTVAGCGVVGEDRVARLLAAKLVAALIHLFEHVAVAHARADEADAVFAAELVKAEVRHHRRNDRAARELPAALHVRAADGKHLVAVDNAALLVDEQGGVIDGDKVLAVCGSDMKRRGKLSGGTIVATVMSNLGLHEFCRENGVGLVCTSVGDRNVLEKMNECGYKLGGEQSGHTIFTDYATTGDGQLTALQFLDVLARSGKKASELASVCPQYPQVLLNVAVSHERGVKDAIMASDALSAAIAEEEGKLSGEGRVLVRPSGTEALIRVMVEAKTEQIALLAAENLVNVIKML